MEKFAELHPEIENKFLETYAEGQYQSSAREDTIKSMMGCIDRIRDTKAPLKIAVMGCGPKPVTIRVLSELDHEVTGIEPVPEFTDYANRYLNNMAKVVIGSCESTTLPENSFDIIFCESVLEHVDSPTSSINEFYRILKPNGVAFIATENRLKFHPLGKNNEFRVRYYNWFPSMVKEGYINMHLHRKPRLADYAKLPAVHWFTFSSLCRLGRTAGFARFYSILDLIDTNNPKVNRIIGGKWLINRIRRNPWIRALFLTQFGGAIFMYKRKQM